MSKEYEAIEKTLSKVAKASRIIKGFCDGLTVVVALIWIALVGFSALGSFKDDGVNPFSVNLGTLLYFSAILLITALFLRTLSQVFSSVKNEETPLQRKQVGRVRILGYLLLGKALVEALFSVGNSVILQFGGWSIMSVDAGVLSDRVLYIDVGTIFAAVVILCLSVVLEYCALLQRLSNETV